MYDFLLSIYNFPIFIPGMEAVNTFPENSSIILNPKRHYLHVFFASLVTVPLWAVAGWTFYMSWKTAGENFMAALAWAVMGMLAFYGLYRYFKCFRRNVPAIAIDTNRHTIRLGGRAFGWKSIKAFKPVVFHNDPCAVYTVKPAMEITFQGGKTFRITDWYYKDLHWIKQYIRQTVTEGKPFRPLEIKVRPEGNMPARRKDFRRYTFSLDNLFILFVLAVVAGFFLVQGIRDGSTVLIVAGMMYLPVVWLAARTVNTYEIDEENLFARNVFGLRKPFVFPLNRIEEVWLHHHGHGEMLWIIMKDYRFYVFPQWFWRYKTAGKFADDLRRKGVKVRDYVNFSKQEF